jgi:hypothetical protein
MFASIGRRSIDAGKRVKQRRISDDCSTVEVQRAVVNVQ